MNNQIPSVSQLVGAVKRNLEGSFRNVTVVGEITNLSSSSSGHWYFSLSDTSSLISSALFKMDAFRNPVIKNLKDGDKVICSGSISVYAKRGTFQLITKRIVQAGKGDLKQQFEMLKKKLASEGLFDVSVKQAIPKTPKKIAVITAEGAAALQDFLNIYKRRALFYNIVLSPALVQGEAAPNSIRKAVEKVIRLHLRAKEENNPDGEIDAIVLTRGGGSLEDLWAFNDEALAYDIYNCPIPVISAVGHQVDYSISDYVADLRAETPSAAAELLTEGQKNIHDRLDYCSSHLKSHVNSEIKNAKLRVLEATPKKILEGILRRVSLLKERVTHLDLIKRRTELIPYEQYSYELDMNIERLTNKMKGLVKDQGVKVTSLWEVLSAINPKNVLQRGYSYTEVEGSVVSSAGEFNELAVDTKIQVHYHDGSVEVRKPK